MCSVCSGILLNYSPHTIENCPYRNSLRCSRCRKRGHTVKTCPDKHFMRFQIPTYLEQLIPEVLRQEYGIETQTLMNPNETTTIDPNLTSPQYLEDLISPSDIQRYRIGSKTKLPREQGCPKPIHKAIYDVVNTPSFFRHVVMCHGEQPSQLIENNIGYTLGYALREGYDYNQMQQEVEVTLKEALKYQRFLLYEMRNRLDRIKKQLKDPNRKEQCYREHKTALEELEREFSGEEIQREVLMKELLKRYEEQMEEAEYHIEEYLDQMTKEFGINILPTEKELKECRKQVLELEKKRARKAKLEEIKQEKPKKVKVKN
jgi:hypothetical protein